MQLKTPMAGVVIDVADEKAEKFIQRGFIPVGGNIEPGNSSEPKPKPKRATTRKKTTKKEQ